LERLLSRVEFDFCDGGVAPTACSAGCRSADRKSNCDNSSTVENTASFVSCDEFPSFVSHCASATPDNGHNDLSSNGSVLQACLRPPPSYQVDVKPDSEAVSSLLDGVTVPSKPTAAVVNNIDFPSLETAASIHERKHSPPLFLKRPKKSQTRRHSQCESDKSEELNSPPLPGHNGKVSDHNLPTNVAVTDDSVVDGSMWTMLPTKDSCRMSETQPRRRSIEDDRTVTVLGSTSSGKHVPSMSMVLADFLETGQVPENDEQSSAERDDERVDFEPLLLCTNCGERTHTIRSCHRSLGAFFCDAE
jgi:hypothetical protein